jgi:phosphoheptose isomerase
MSPRLYRDILTSALSDGAALRRRVLHECGGDVLRAAKLVSDALRSGKKVLFVGNGGSAADAQHFAAEMVCRYRDERQPLAAIALTVDSSALTAIANDYGFDQVFARQVRALAQPGDVLFAITTSGRSPNVSMAMAAARERGAHVLGLTSSRAGSDFVSACDVCVRVPSSEVARIQEIHLTVGHVICELVDLSLSAPFPELESAAYPGKVTTLDALAPIRGYWRAQKKTVVWTNGCFDILHAGHVRSLYAARALGDVLVVGLNSDASVRALKGDGRPVFAAAERASVLAALEPVDHVIVFDDATPILSLERLQPDVHCKGADYAGKPLPEEATVTGYGGRIAFLPLEPGLSTTAALKRLG